MTDTAKILHYTDPMLRKVCEPVTSFDPALASLAETLCETLRTYPRHGVGLAAPQIGVLLRVIVVQETRASPMIVMVNPVITYASETKATSREGCLSVPEFDVDMERSTRILVTAQRVDGSAFKMKPRNFFARVIQHEYDHLIGVTIADKIAPRTERYEGRRDRSRMPMTAAIAAMLATGGQ